MLDPLVGPPAAVELWTGEAEPGVVTVDECCLLPSDPECLAVFVRESIALKPLLPAPTLPFADAAAAAAAAPLCWFW